MIDNNGSIDEKIIGIKKENRLAIFEDTKPNTSKDAKPNTSKYTKPDIKINKKTLLEVFEIVKGDIKRCGDWEKRKTTWVFWKSHVSELHEKWVCSRGNYAYTRFEEFRTCSGEVLFTNEHKAVFSKNEAKSYIDINDLETFKDFSRDSKTIFKNKPITAKTIKIIKAKKDSNIKDSCLKTIEEYACTIESMRGLLQNCIYEIDDNFVEINRLYNNLPKAGKSQKEILKKVDELANNLLDIIWGMVYKEDKTVTENADLHMIKDINILKKIVRDNKIEQAHARNDIISLFYEIVDRLDSVNKKLHKAEKIDKNGIHALEKDLKNHATIITKRLTEIASKF